MSGFLGQAFVYLAAAVIAVPIAKRLGLGSVLGYLLAGVAIGPFGLGLIGEEGQDVMHFAEFGVVMMLFLIGLELQPALLWKLRGPVLGLGGSQVGLTAVLIAALALAFGLPWQTALAIGLILALSSTAIVLQTLAEKGWMKTGGGQASFSVLLFQDIAVIPMLALLPLLALPAAHGGLDHALLTASLPSDAVQLAAGGGGDSHSSSVGYIETLPAWGQALAVLVAVAAIILAGRTILRPIFRAIAGTRLRELFTAAALMLIIGIALLMEFVGLSPALGTFLAGVVLADSEYRHELESDIEPFKGLLLGLFFLAVGASIDFALVIGQPGLIAGLVAGLLAVKFLVLVVLARIFKLSLDQNLMFSFALAQGGEFGFVLFSFATQRHVLSPDVAAPLVVTVALTMALTPLLIVFYEKVIAPRVGTPETDGRPADEMDEDEPVIICGYGHFGNIVGRFLRANGVQPTVIDNNSDRVERMRQLGLKVFYGDATRHDLLAAAGAERAKIIVLAIGNTDIVRNLNHTIHKHYPHLQVIARADGYIGAYALLGDGVERIYRETLDTALAAGVDILRDLGSRGHAAVRAARIFKQHDERFIRELATMRDDERAWVSGARERIRELELSLQDEVGLMGKFGDDGWDTTSLRKEIQERAGLSSR